MTIGVILVSYNTGDILIDCLESLLGAAQLPEGENLKVLLVDNASPKPMQPVIEAWAAGQTDWDSSNKPFTPRTPRSPVTVDARDFKADGYHTTLGTAADNTIGFLQAGDNGGFAAGVNHGLRTFEAMEDVDYFWILNSDAMIEDHTATRLMEATRAEIAAHGRVGILGGRTFFTHPPLMIQTDGGRIDMRTGRLLPATLGKTGRDVPGPRREDVEYIPGCHMLVSRDYLKQAGLMPEEYFLFFEEIDWCMRRGDLSLVFVPEAPIHHQNGSSIGSQTMTEGPSPVAAYWMFKNRLRFIRTWNFKALPIAYLYAFGKIAQFVRRKHYSSAKWALWGVLGLPRP
jgi:GT2 family glycosyltransferase